MYINNIFPKNERKSLRNLFVGMFQSTRGSSLKINFEIFCQLTRVCKKMAVKYSIDCILDRINKRVN